MNKKKDLSKEDIKTWDSYIKNPTDVHDKDNSIPQNLERKERFKFDLHGHTLDDANQKVREIIYFCVKNKYREVLFITGKGLHSTSGSDAYVSKDFSKLKYSVPDFLKRDEDLNKFIVTISHAEKKDGGEGAILIKLRNL